MVFCMALPSVHHFGALPDLFLSHSLFSFCLPACLSLSPPFLDVFQLSSLLSHPHVTSFPFFPPYLSASLSLFHSFPVSEFPFLLSHHHIFFFQSVYLLSLLPRCAIQTDVLILCSSCVLRVRSQLRSKLFLGSLTDHHR